MQAGHILGRPSRRRHCLLLCAVQFNKRRVVKSTNHLVWFNPFSPLHARMKAAEKEVPDANYVGKGSVQVGWLVCWHVRLAKHVMRAVASAVAGAVASSVPL